MESLKEPRLQSLNIGYDINNIMNEEEIQVMISVTSNIKNEEEIYISSIKDY